MIAAPIPISSLPSDHMNGQYTLVWQNEHRPDATPGSYYSSTLSSRTIRPLPSLPSCSLQTCPTLVSPYSIHSQPPPVPLYCRPRNTHDEEEIPPRYTEIEAVDPSDGDTNDLVHIPITPASQSPFDLHCPPSSHASTMNQVRDRPHSFPQPGSLAFPQPSPNPVGSPSAIPFSPRPSTACDARYQSFPTLGSTTSATSNPSPPVTYPLPTLERLKETASELNGLSSHAQLAWAEDVLRLCERHWDQCLSEPNQGGSSHTTSGIPSKLKDLLDIAVPMIITLATDPDRTLSSLASYLKAILLSSGACPDHLPKDPRQAFRDFEAAARGGEHRGWYRLAKDYELVGDIPRAKDCLDRGVRHGDCESTYRLGMAYLLGQLNLQPNPAKALTLLHSASDTTSIDCPSPSHVYGLLLSHELELPGDIPPIPHHLLLPRSASPKALFQQHYAARETIKRAAYFCHAAAQYKCGFMYEHATLGCLYDPLMSVQWYSLASQGGEIEADMALSKWFLCGADGCFAKNEDLARTFAEKAARKGHPNGCFAMGYYYELGIGGRRDIDQAKKWYQRAAKLGNEDATVRLSALSAPQPHSISMADYEAHLNSTLVRRRTQAKLKSDRHHHSTRVNVHDNRRYSQPNCSLTDEVPNTPRLMARGRGPMSSPVPISKDTLSPSVSHAKLVTPNPGGWPSPSPYPHRTRLESPAGPREPIPKPRFRWDEGPQTFAEMGFVSKPLEEEGCVLM